MIESNLPLYCVYVAVICSYRTRLFLHASVSIILRCFFRLWGAYHISSTLWIAKVVEALFRFPEAFSFAPLSTYHTLARIRQSPYPLSLNKVHSEMATNGQADSGVLLSWHGHDCDTESCCWHLPTRDRELAGKIMRWESVRCQAVSYH